MYKTVDSRLEAVLEARVRPVVRAHGGDVRVKSLDGGVLVIDMVEGCAGCPSAQFYMEALVADSIAADVPEITDVRISAGVSDDLINQAKRLLSLRARASA